MHRRFSYLGFSPPNAQILLSKQCHRNTTKRNMFVTCEFAKDAAVLWQCHIGVLHQLFQLWGSGSNNLSSRGPSMARCTSDSDNISKSMIWGHQSCCKRSLCTAPLCQDWSRQILGFHHPKNPHFFFRRASRFSLPKLSWTDPRGQQHASKQRRQGKQEEQKNFKMFNGCKRNVKVKKGYQIQSTHSDFKELMKMKKQGA